MACDPTLGLGLPSERVLEDGAANTLAQAKSFDVKGTYSTPAGEQWAIEVQFARHIANGRAAATAADVEGEAFGVKGVVRQPGQVLLFHGAAPAAVHASDLDLQVNARVATGQVADPTQFVIVEAALRLPTDPTGRFFRRRRNDTTRALGSPKMPRTAASGRKPGKRYVSGRRMVFRMWKSCQVSMRTETQKPLEKRGEMLGYSRLFTHTLWRRAKRNGEL